jgi:Na+-translocating ferredoxin:NAD+ oxidoreductase RnfC subunit
LAQYFSFAKALHYKQTKEQQKADVARERFEFKEFRVERNKAERSAAIATTTAKNICTIMPQPKKAYAALMPSTSA